MKKNKQILLLSLGMFAAIAIGVFAQKSSSTKTAATKVATRTVANATQEKQQKILDDITNRLIENIKTADDVETVGGKIIEDYKNDINLPAVKIYLSALKAMPEFRSIFWRLRKIVEPADLIHAGAISGLRSALCSFFLWSLCSPVPVFALARGAGPRFPAP